MNSCIRVKGVVVSWINLPYVKVLCLRGFLFLLRGQKLKGMFDFHDPDHVDPLGSALYMRCSVCFFFVVGDSVFSAE